MNLAVSTNLKIVSPTILVILAMVYTDTASNKLQLTEMTHKVKLYSKMGRFTRVSYREITKKVMGYRFGQMGHVMKVYGTGIKLQVKASSCMRTGMSLMGNGERIKRTALGPTFIKMVLFLQVNGLMINSMVKAKKVIPMGQLIKACTNWERRQAEGCTNGSMAAAILAPGWTTRLKVLARIIGPMGDAMQASGRTT